MNMNGNIFIALLHSREPVGGPLLVVARRGSGPADGARVVESAAPGGNPREFGDADPIAPSGPDAMNSAADRSLSTVTNR